MEVSDDCEMLHTVHNATTTNNNFLGTWTAPFFSEGHLKKKKIHNVQLTHDCDLDLISY